MDLDLKDYLAIIGSLTGLASILGTVYIKHFSSRQFLNP